jgi:N-carbamoyl-L-amino-acid hydrolase
MFSSAGALMPRARTYTINPDRLRASLESLPSGAGHDAQMLARIAPMGMIFVPSAEGISHLPKELTRWEDAANGCDLLFKTVLAIDSR